MRALIAFLIFIFVLLIISIVQDLILGDLGKRNNITNLYKHIKGSIAEQTNRVSQNERYERSLLTRRYFLFMIPVCFIMFIVSLLAFRSLFLSTIISLLGLTFPKAMISNTLKKRKERLNFQFRDALNSIMQSLKAGLSINSALIKCADDLERIYMSVKEKPILLEFRKIKNDLSMGASVDDVLLGFGKRAKLEDVDDFTNSIIIVRQKGGNLVEVMENVTKVITDRIAIKNEISVLTASKRVEARILVAIPIFIIVSISLLSPSYMEPLYSTFWGKILILLGIVFLVINYYIGKKITNINV
jgi:tight adherence protein B